MILSFANTKVQTERIWNGHRSKHVPAEIQNRTLAKLMLLHAADSLEDLRNPPGNRLHELKDDRAGQHSISINRQWRICFRFKDGNAYDVEIIDYHD
ncbi:MAG: type II toxin-antitoxin system RelE/ParE family toxin [Novosphingobium sp.]|uniref:type II toxin-antitoxin system RelE/ParE family toxin n=1 Tax=Novosphingobium sp. TaxID=1874826 RepID=UPI003C7AE853